MTESSSNANSNSCPSVAGRLAGRKILITGAASGIGLATARLFIQSGASVALLDVNKSLVEKEALACGGIPIVADLCHPPAVDEGIALATEQMGGLDGVVNSAGIPFGKSLVDISVAEWKRVIDINLTGPFLVCKAAIPWLTKQGGTIVNIASGAGLMPIGNTSNVYSASKGGLIAFTKALAQELAPDIRANSICPGLTLTPMTAHFFEGVDKELASSPMVANYALKRPAEPIEVARACLYLTSDESSFVTGSTLVVDGGRIFH